MKHTALKKISVTLSFLLIMTSFLSGCGHDPDSQEMRKQKDYSSSKVSYLGPEGTYTQEACESFFMKKGEYIPFRTVPEAVEALTSGESDYAVIPQENTIGGAVTDYIDTLIDTPGLSMEGEVELPIRQNLLALPGTELSDIRMVYSHKQGIAQSRRWLEENLPDAELVEVSSTAEGAKKVSKSKEKNCAAIASAGCARLYSLDILAENIQKNDKNKTRFYVLSTKAPSHEKAERMAFIASGSAEELPSLMTRISEQDLILVTLHDRPLKTRLGEYHYVIECAGGSYQDYEKLTRNSAFTFRFLGCFNVK